MMMFMIMNLFSVGSRSCVKSAYLVCVRLACWLFDDFLHVSLGVSCVRVVLQTAFVIFEDTKHFLVRRSRGLKLG
jgi:hypothetical protein